MQKIVPCLWFNDNGEEAVNFYTSIFNNSKIGTVMRYGKASSEVAQRPLGSVLTISFHLEGQEFMALNGGPVFKFTPATSFFINCSTETELDGYWKKLSAGAEVLMELDEYPFSKKFGWLQDRFGVSWQLSLSERRQKITPFLMFVGQQNGNAEKAVNFYLSLIKDSRIQKVERYGAGEQGVEGTVKHMIFTLHGQEFMASDGGRDHGFTFTPAISWMINCGTQNEVDQLWEKLSANGQKEDCGWLRDQFGVSWQVVPEGLNELLDQQDPVKAENVMKVMLQMKKLEIKPLQDALRG